MMQIRMKRNDRIRRSGRKFKAGQVLSAPKDLTERDARLLLTGGSAEQIGVQNATEMADRVERNVPKRDTWIVLKHRIRP